MHKISYLILLINTCNSAAQIFPNALKSWPDNVEYNKLDFGQKKNDRSEITGVYTFGDSESEVEVIIQLNNESIDIQFSYFKYLMDSMENYLPTKTYETYNDVHIQEDGIFRCSVYEGVFARYSGAEFIYEHALILNRIPGMKMDINLKDSGQVGFKTSNLDDYYSIYDYPQLFLENLDSIQLRNELSEKEIWILKNSLYAKYGYVFNNKYLADYFSSKSWYSPTYNLPPRIAFTRIEENNLKLLVAMEKNKKK